MAAAIKVCDCRGREESIIYKGMFSHSCNMYLFSGSTYRYIYLNHNETYDHLKVWVELEAHYLRIYKCLPSTWGTCLRISIQTQRIYEIHLSELQLFITCFFEILEITRIFSKHPRRFFKKLKVKRGGRGSITIWFCIQRRTNEKSFKKHLIF